MSRTCKTSPPTQPLRAPHGARLRRARRRASKREQGVALIIAMTSVALLAVLVADLHESASTSYTAALVQRDQLQAEYMAKSGLNLTRMLVGNEPQIRQVVAPL